MCIVADSKSHAHYIISMLFSDWPAAMDLLSLGKKREFLFGLICDLYNILNNYTYHETIGRDKLFEV